MQAIARAANWLSRILAYLGAATVVAMMLLICFDVAARSLFRVSWNPTPEIVARYFMVGIAFLPLAWLELRRQMISVELLDFMMNDRLRRLSDFTVMLAATVIYGALAYTTWGKALKEAKIGTLVEIGTTKMPVWHSYFLPPIGFTLGALACLIAAIAIWSPTAEAELNGSANER